MCPDNCDMADDVQNAFMSLIGLLEDKEIITKEEKQDLWNESQGMKRY